MDGWVVASVHLVPNVGHFLLFRVPCDVVLGSGERRVKGGMDGCVAASIHLVPNLDVFLLFLLRCEAVWCAGDSGWLNGHVGTSSPKY